MEQKLKELLKKDLCSRLPYSLKVKRPDDGTPDYLSAIDIEAGTLMVSYNGYTDEIEKFVPYLRPMSSMTEEESKEYFSICTGSIRGDMIAKIDFYIKHHFDFRLTPEGLSMIEAGLALEAPDGMYNLNEK